MTVAGTPSSPQCGGTVSSTSNSISLSNGTLAPGTQCTVNVSVNAAIVKNYTNTSNAVTSTNGGTGNTASATLIVTAILPPAFTDMSYSPNQILTNATSTLTFTIRNPNSSTTLTGIAFSDTYPTQLVNINPPATSNTCGGSLLAIGNGNSIALSGGTLAAGTRAQ